MCVTLPRAGSIGKLVEHQQEHVVTRIRTSLAVLGLLSLPLESEAQQPDTAQVVGRDRTEAARVLSVRATAGPIRLDGRLDDADWSRADSIVDFRQREPDEGAPASERTTAKVLRDDDALYVAVRAWDRQMPALRATQLRRDADLRSDDNLSLLIDSFHDRRSGFLFRTNANGAMWDAQLTGAGDDDADWNGIWSVATARDSTGWTAEFRIPFRSLRFDAGAGAAFGFNVRRFIRRTNEEVLWQSWGRTQGLSKLQNAGDLVGLGVLKRARNIELKPYALARAVTATHGVDGERTGSATSSAKGGLDAKLAVSPTLTADFTVNTDFAQVESDRQAINLSRFPLFFPEKRDFFLESGSIFAFGTPSSAQLFYSRRIGVRDGQPVPILGGARLYGKSGPWTLGVLDARTGGTDQVNAAVVRVKRDVLDRSYLGAIATQRSGPGAPRAERSFGIDGGFPLVIGGHNLEPAFWLAGTQLPGLDGTALAWRAVVDYPNDLFDNVVTLSRIAAGFAPTLGFVRRAGLVQTTGAIRYLPRPHVLGIRQLELKPIPSWNIIADEHGNLTNPHTWQSAEFEWRFLGGSFQSGDDFELNLQRHMDGPAEAFDVFDNVSIAAGRYWFTRGEAQYSTSSGRPLSMDVQVNWGQYYDGRSTTVELGTTWRGGGHVILGVDVRRTSAHLPSGSFTAIETATRVEYAFNPRTSFLAFVQHNNEDKEIGFNLRFHWIPTIGDDVYVVWNSGYTTDVESRYRFPSRSSLTRQLNGALVVKAVHRFAP